MESEVFGHEKGAFTGAIDVRPGCFEMADGGTLFLDEIGEMPLGLQPKLLRVLEDGRVRRLGGKREFTCDVRLLAATNRDPQEAVSEGRLREDLYYRMNVCNVHLPPLRRRKGDVSLLVEYFRGELNRKHRTAVKGVRKEAMDLLEGKAEINETMIAIQKADVSMRLLLTFRNKVIEAYREIMHMNF